MLTKISQIALAAAGIAAVLLALLLLVNPRQAACTGPRWRRRLLAAGLGLLAGLGLTPAGLGMAWAGPPAVKPDPELAASPEWKRIAAAWDEAADFAWGSGQEVPTDEASRGPLRKRLAAAKQDLAGLTRAGKLDPAEAAILAADLARLERELRVPDAQAMTCYDMTVPTLAQASLDRLSARLPLLESLAASRILHRQVLERVVAQVERDLERVRAAKTPAELPASKSAEAQAAVKGVSAALERLKAKLARP